MKYLNRASIVITLADQLKAAGSWCGETHVQKTVYFLESLLSVPLGFKFILYKHGPYSFDLADTLTEMRADGLVVVEPSYPNGVNIGLGENAHRVLDLASELRKQYLSQITFVAQRLGPLGVTELEKLATAYWVTEECPACTAEERARRINELKPHITVEESRNAIAKMEDLRHEATSLLS